MSLHRFAIVFLALLSLFASSSVSTAEAPDPLVVSDCSFGEVYQFSAAGCTASLENRGASPLNLSIIPVQPGISVSPEKVMLAPNAHANLVARVRTDNIAGKITWTYRIEGAGKEPQFLHASGFVSSILDAGHPTINFGSIDPSGAPLMQSIVLSGSVEPKVRISKILSSDPMLHARVAEDGRTLVTEIRSDAPWGPFDSVVKLALDSLLQKEVWVGVSGDVAGEIGPKENPYWVGELARVPNLTLKVPLISRETRDFSIGNVASSEFAATYESSPCEPAQAGCQTLVIHVAPSQPAGYFKSSIDVAVADRQKHVSVVVWGVLGEQPEAGRVASAPVVTKMPLSIPRPDESAPIPPLKTQADPPGSGPLLKWTIDQQEGVHGYQIFRGDSAEGPFTLMEPHVIQKLENGKGSVAYRWRDTNAVKGQTYWYYIAVLYSSGDRKALSGVQKALAK